MDESTEVFLLRWGDSDRKANATGLGIGMHPLAMAMEYGTRIRGSDTPEDIQVERIDNLVRRLSKHRPKAAKAVRVRYRNLDLNGNGLSDEDCARIMGVSRSTFQRWLKCGREYIDKHL